MKQRRPWILIILLLLVVIVTAAFFWFRPLLSQVDFAGSLGSGEEAAVNVPPGFQASVYAEGLSAPRFMTFGPDGALYVADQGTGRVVRLPDDNGDGRADSSQTFANGLDAPHSVVYHEGAWYVGVPSGVVRLIDEDGDGTADSQEAVVDDLPTGDHSTRTVEFLPDGRMVISIGSSCNVCFEQDNRRAAILVYDDAEGNNPQLFANGLRNAVGLTIKPDTG
jgi:glucose/arabinose dehydrogenase